MHALLWILSATVAILLFGGIITAYHYYAGVCRRRAAEQLEQRFLADAFELEQLRGDHAWRAYFLDLTQYRHYKYLLTLLPLVRSSS